MSAEKITFSCVEVTQPIGTFYMGAMDYRDLLSIAWADVRGLEEKRRDVEIYSGIQRELSPGRVRDISKYVALVDATFPTSVILAVSSDHATYDAKNHRMSVTKDQSVAKILDGQHRIAGLKEHQDSKMIFQVNVVIFIDMELEDQAIVFATINKTQTKVNKSLVSDLFDFATTRSPQKTAHNIARALNEKPGSPFFGKIKILGVADDREKETITQATFVDSLIRYVSLDPMGDRDCYKRGRTPAFAAGKDARKLFLRNFFLRDQDEKIAKIVWSYFDAVSEKWPEAWKIVRPDYILNRSTGFIALMRFLRPAYLSFDRPSDVISTEEFTAIFSRIHIPGGRFTKDIYIPGTTGQSQLYNELLDKSGLSAD